MKIETGEACRLVVPGVFTGTASRHDGRLYFLTQARPAMLRSVGAGLMDGKRVALRLISAPDKSDPFCTMEIVA